MATDNQVRRIWLVLKDEGVSDNLDFLCKHFWSANYELTPHIHRAHELIFVTGGQGTLYSNDVGYQLNRGDLLVVEPGTVHKGRAHPENPFELFTLGYHFQADRLYADPALFGLDNLFLELFKLYKHQTKRTLVPNCDQLDEVLNDLFQETIEKQSYRQELMRSYLIQFFVLLARKLKAYVDRNHSTLDTVEAIIRAKKHIHTHFQQPLTLEDIARVACLSPSHFCRIFKQETDYTPIEFLNSVRFENAKTLLLFSNFTLTEIADRIGFSSIHYFSRTFKKHQGISPLAYRQAKGLSPSRRNALIRGPQLGEETAVESGR